MPMAMPVHLGPWQYMYVIKNALLVISNSLQIWDIRNAFWIYNIWRYPFKKQFLYKACYQDKAMGPSCGFFDIGNLKQHRNSYEIIHKTNIHFHINNDRIPGKSHSSGQVYILSIYLTIFRKSPLQRDPSKDHGTKHNVRRGKTGLTN